MTCIAVDYGGYYLFLRNHFFLYNDLILKCYQTVREE